MKTISITIFDPFDADSNKGIKAYETANGVSTDLKEWAENLVNSELSKLIALRREQKRQIIEQYTSVVEEATIDSLYEDANAYLKTQKEIAEAERLSKMAFILNPPQN
jgi:hypothetical protein